MTKQQHPTSDTTNGANASGREAHPPQWVLDDTSRWTVIGSRFEAPAFLREEMNRMMREFVDSLPADDPARLLWELLPKAPGWGGGE